jgi:predicted nucleotidyltransferase
MDFLDGKAREVAIRVVAEEEARRRHVVVALSGAHAYGFPSPDSDLDLKAVHLAPVRNLLGLSPQVETFERMEVIDGVEVDYTSNELRPVIAGILQGNGNFIERVLGALLPHTTPDNDELRVLVQAALSRRVHRHYRGFAASQRKAFETGGSPTAKQLLYVLRTALTGVHLLLTGELRVDLRTNIDEHGFADARDLIEAKRQGERVVLDPAMRAAWMPRLDGLFDLLDRARTSSPLPEEPANHAALDQWLVATRMRHLTDHSIGESLSG